MPAAAQVVRLNRVIDGDTVEVQLEGGWLQSSRAARIRLWGIDAPETGQPLGDRATRHLRRLIGRRRRLYLETVATDQYSRAVGIIHPGKPEGKQPDNSYNRRMLADGWAYAYMLSGPRREAYQEAEAQARRRRRGVWKEKAGSRKGEIPREFRQRRRRRAAAGRRIKWYLAAALATAATGAYAWWFITQQLLPRLAG